MSKIKVGIHAPFYQSYIDKVNIDPMMMLGNQITELSDYLNINTEKLTHRYGEGKWSIREVVLHICDTETVFAYRLLRIARGDKTPLPGFDQDIFIDGNDFTHLDAHQLIEHFINTRKFTITLVNSLTKDQLDRVGEASGQKVSGGSIVYMIAGHTKHHINILLERY